MLVDRARYEHGYRVDGAAPTADRPKDGSSFVWVGLADPTPVEIEAVADEFSLHPLAVEDCLSGGGDVEKVVRRAAGQLVSDRTRRRPMIVPVVLDA